MQSFRRAILVVALNVILVLPALSSHTAVNVIVLSSASTPEDRPGQSTWVDEIEKVLGTYFKAKYRGSDFDPYVKELDRIRAALGRRDERTVRVETGVFLRMLANRDYGIEQDAAKELIDVTETAMPAQEYGIIFPGDNEIAGHRPGVYQGGAP